MPDSTEIHPAEAALERIQAAEQATLVKDATPSPVAELAADAVQDTPSEEQPDGAPEASELSAKPEGEEESPDESPEEQTHEEEDVSEFGAELTKHGAPKLEDLPPEMRPLAEKRLKEMNAAFTRAQQEATSFRREKAEFDAKVAYERDNPVDAIVERLLGSPTLLDKVNEELTKLQEPVYAEAKDLRRQAMKDKAVVEAERARREAEAREARVVEVETFFESAAAKHGIPAKLAEPHVAFAIQQKGNLTNEEIEAVVKQAAQVYKRSVGAHKRESVKAYAKQKQEDKAAALKVKPGTPSAIPTPVKREKPKTAQDAYEQILTGMGVPE